MSDPEGLPPWAQVGRKVTIVKGANDWRDRLCEITRIDMNGFVALKRLHDDMPGGLSKRNYDYMKPVSKPRGARRRRKNAQDRN